MDLLSARQRLVAGNLANADTAGYRTKDIDFAAGRHKTAGGIGLVGRTAATCAAEALRYRCRAPQEPGSDLTRSSRPSARAAWAKCIEPEIPSSIAPPARMDLRTRMAVRRAARPFRPPASMLTTLEAHLGPEGNRARAARPGDLAECRRAGEIRRRVVERRMIERTVRQRAQFHLPTFRNRDGLG